MEFIDMFCGIGGVRLGLDKSNRQQQENPEVGGCGDSISNKGKQPSESEKWGNYTCIWANDNDKYACQIYRRHWNDGTLQEGDIRAIDADSIPEHDLLCAGFPCQSFSIAGKRRGFQDTRGTLFFEICRVLWAKRPSYLLLENVKGLLSDGDGRTFQTILKSLDELGYDCQWQVLNSKNFRVPQNRERVFIIGHLRGKPRLKVFPIGEDNQQGESENKIGVVQSEYVAGCIQEGMDRRLGLDGSITFVANAVDVDGYLRTGARPRDENGKPQLLPIGYRRIRRLTPLECERLQSFPDGWTEGISDTQRYKCLGNAVTVNVIEAIGRQINEY